jgi:hypothetical protein
MEVASTALPREDVQQNTRLGPQTLRHRRGDTPATTRPIRRVELRAQIEAEIKEVARQGKRHAPPTVPVNPPATAAPLDGRGDGDRIVTALQTPDADLVP